MQIEDEQRPELPDYLPARMVNEFVYCPRLFFYEWVEGVFRESADTVEGKVQHQRIDRDATTLPEAGEMPQEKIHSLGSTLFRRLPRYYEVIRLLPEPRELVVASSSSTAEADSTEIS